MQPRSPEVWRASSVLFLTQEGFPAGRAVGNTALATADQGRFQSLAVLYAELATSDRVRALAERSGKIDGDIVAEPVIYDIGQYARTGGPSDGSGLRHRTYGTTSFGRSTAGVRRSSALCQERPVEREDPAKGTVLIETARSGAEPGSEPILVSGPSKAVPIVVFALLLGLLLMAIFAYHNFRSNLGQDLLEGAQADDVAEGATARTRPEPVTSAIFPARVESAKPRPQRPRAVLSVERPSRGDPDAAAAAGPIQQPEQT